MKCRVFIGAANGEKLYLSGFDDGIRFVSPDKEQAIFVNPDDFKDFIPDLPLSARLCSKC